MADSLPAAAAPARRRFFYGWYIVGGTVLSNAVLSAAYFQGFASFFLPIERHFGWSRSAISGAISVRQVESGILGPGIGFLVDRWGARRIIVAGAVISGLGLIWLGLITNLLTFYLAFLVVSIGTAGVSHGVTWPTVIARWFRRKRGLAMGLAVMGPIVGSPFVILNTALLDDFGWRRILIAYGVLVIGMVSLIGLVARDRPEPYGYLPDGDAAPPSRPGERPSRRGPMEAGLTLPQVVHTKEFWLLTVYLSGMFVGNSGFSAHQIPYFVNDRGFSDAAAAGTLTLMFMASGLGRIGTGVLLDRVDYRVILITVAVVMAGAFVYLQLAPITTLWQAVPFTIIYGIAFGATVPMRGALGSMLFGNRSLGAVIGLLQGGSVAAGFLGPILMGIAFDSRGDYRSAIWLLFAATAVVIPPVLFMASPRAIARRSTTTA